MLEPPSSLEQSNGWAAVEGVFWAVVNGENDRLYDFLAPDFAGTSRERLSFQERTLDRDQWIAALLAFQRDGAITNPTTDRIAVRGSTGFLSRSRADVAGSEIELLFVNHVNDGQISTSVIFGPEQLREAVAELDRQWVESGGPAWVVESMRPVIDAFESGDESRILACVTPRFRCVDHRPLGMGERDAEGWASSMASLGGGLQWYASDIMRAADGVGLFRYISTLIGDGSSWDVVSLSVLESGRVSEQHMYEPQQVDEAHRHFEQLVNERRRGSATTDH